MIGTETESRVDSFASACGRVWAEESIANGPRYLSRAPARLDVMGGDADYTGSLVLQCALPVVARVGIAPRSDQKVSITSIGWSNNGENARSVWPLSALYTAAGELTSPANFAAYFDTAGCSWARHVAGVFYTLLEAGVVPHFAGGASIVIQSDIPSGAGIGASAAIAVASGWALVALTGRTVDPIELARLCQRAETFIAGVPTGITDKAVALLAESGTLLQMRCQPHEVLGHVPICPGAAFVGIDSAVQSPKRLHRFIETRVAAFMGLRIIESILRGEPSGKDMTAGYLANITPIEYVERLRDRIPTKMKGRDFLERYGHISDPATRVAPDTVYKVRSRTEHHIYENDRAHRFAERMSRAARTQDRSPLVEAGELMYASHWSYSQRCGMGSIETDILVSLLREQGVDRGIYGAKVTSAGCGGSVAVLLADTPTAHEAVEEACQAYAMKTGREPAIFTGSADGAAARPPQRLD